MLSEKGPENTAEIEPMFWSALNFEPGRFTSRKH